MKYKLPISLQKKFNVVDNGLWCKYPAVIGPFPYFWFNPNYEGRKAWISHGLYDKQQYLTFE